MSSPRIQPAVADPVEPSADDADQPLLARRVRWGLAGAGAVVVVSAVAPALLGVDVRAGTAPPLLGDWAVRAGWSSAVALGVVAVTAWLPLRAVVHRLPWGRLLGASWVASVVWMVSLALVDGPAGLGRVLDDGTEYLQSARGVDDVGHLLHEYVARIPLESPGHWPVHLAGHPPGAVLFFVALARMGLGSWQAAGVVVVLVAATTPAAVAVALRGLGAEDAARRALPFLVVGPFAVVQAVSADAVFAATAAWGAAALATALGPRRMPSRVLLAGVGGLLLGWCLMQSYGLVLLGVLALGVVLASRAAPPVKGVVVAVAGASTALVVLTFAALGFAWWEAFPVLHQRYWAGIAHLRPAWYWLVGNVGAALIVAGAAAPAGVAAGADRVRRAVRSPSADPVATLVLAGLVMVAVADLSLMSKAEVERIWLPFLPWVLLSVVWLPERWWRRALVAQAAAGLLLQHLVRTVW